MRRLGAVYLLFLALLPVGESSAGPVYFPLATGNRWVYQVEHPIFSGSRVVVVGEEDAGLFLVRTQSSGPGPLASDVRLRAAGNEVDIELPGGELAPYYRFDEDAWVHRDVFECNDGVSATVVSRSEVVETPAGVFTDCLEVVFAPRCADAGLLAEWWAPGIGLVRAEEGNFAGAVAWVLSDVEIVGAGDRRFLRGDAGADGEVDSADMLRILTHLFLHGPPHGCADVMDVNDDGEIDIADPVFGFFHLFLDGPAPPSPGTAVPGYDGTPADPFACGDPPPGELPGVRLDLTEIPASLTLAEAAAGVTFRYAVVVEAGVPGVASLPLDAGQCDAPGPSGLRLLERLSGEGQTFCLCDVGRCFPQVEPLDLLPGRHAEALEWTGRNWFGPSDTGNAMGDPFPPGRYIFEVRAEGTYAGPPGARALPFEIRAEKELELLP
jgi:hypothetical protein